MRILCLSEHLYINENSYAIVFYIYMYIDKVCIENDMRIIDMA